METPEPRRTTVPGVMFKEAPCGTTTVLLTATTPMAGLHVLLPARAPPTVVVERAEITFKLVEKRTAPELSPAERKSRFIPGFKGELTDHAPVPELIAASSPLIRTRVEPGSVLVPAMGTELEVTMVKNWPAAL